MNKRKIDEIWKNLYYIQQLTSKDHNMDRIMHIEYDYERDKDCFLYHKAFDMVNIMAMHSDEKKF